MKTTLLDKFDYFNETFNCFGTFLLKQNDNEIAYLVFEEFITYVVSFLHKETLDPLLEAGLINKDVYDLSSKLRAKVLELDCGSLWNIESVKTSKIWYDLMVLSDTIKSMI